LSAWAPIYINTLSTGAGAANVYLGTSYINGQTAWHAGNDGSGSGLDADTLDGVQATGFLYRDVTNSGYNINLTTDTGGAAGLYVENSSNAFKFQLYGDGTDYGFLDGKWASWDLKKAIGGNLSVDHGGTLYTVWDAYNDGSGSGLDADTVDGIHAGSFLRSDADDSTSAKITITGASAPLNLAYLNIGSAGSGETRAIDIDGAWSGGESKSISWTHGSASTNLVAQINGQHVGPGSKLRFGKLYHSGDSGTYTMELTSTSATTANLTVNGNTVWHAGNDGSGSGLDADTVDGLQVNSSTTNNQANVLVRTQANGYIHAGWINSVSGSSGTSSRLTRITASYDAYLRYLDPASFKVQIGESYKNTYSRSVDYTTDSNYWVGSFGHASYDANQTFHAGSGFFDIWSGSNYPPGTSHIHGFNALHYTVGSISGNTGNAYGWQMAAQYNQDTGPWWRRCNAGSFTSWRKIWHDTNDGSGSGLDADTLDGYQGSNYIGLNSNSYFQLTTWLQSTSSHGFYSPNSGAGTHFYPAGLGNYGSFSCEGRKGGWGGYSIEGRVVFMHNGSTASGIYNDVNNHWLFYAVNGDKTSMYHNGSEKIYTYASGGRVTGDWLATGDVYAYYSDERLKDKTGKVENAIEKVKEIETFYYTHNEKAIELGYEGTEQQIGVSAQSVEKVLPEVVHLAPIDDDGEGNSVSGEEYKTVNYGRLVPLLIQAIKEQQAQIEELKEKLK